MGLVVVTHSLRAAVMVTNLGETQWAQSDTLYQTSPFPPFVTQQGTGQKFTTGSTASILSTVTISFAAGSGAAGFSLGLYADGASSPGALIETLLGSVAPINISDYGFTSGGSTILSPNTTYWLVSETTQTAGNYFRFNVTNSAAETSSSGWTIDNSIYQNKPLSSGWSNVGAFPVKLSISASAVPEPSTYALFVLSALGFLIFRRRSRTA